MRIGFDGKRAVQNNTGLGNYSRYLIEILSEYYSDVEYVVFAPKKRENPRLKTLSNRSNVSFSYPSNAWKRFSSLWRVFLMKKSLQSQKIDIFHGLSNEIPFGIDKMGVKSVVTIHDLIFLRYPQYYQTIDRFIYKIKFKYACEHADRVVAISECTKRDIVSFFNIPENKIEVIYQGCHEAFRKQVGEEKKREIVQKYQLPPNFLLCVGSIEPRKNLLLIAKSLSHLPVNIHLVAIGKRTEYQSEVENYVQENGLTDRVHIFNNVPFEDLPAFYSLAKIFVYPSFFEGFGIPIIEALSQGVPVIAAKGSCLEEAGGEGSIYIDPNDEMSLAKNIQLIWSDDEKSKTMSAEGKKYVEKFADKKIAEQFMQLYNSLT